MLTLKAEASAGTSLRDEMLPEALLLARATGARIEIEANESKFWILPTDSLGALKAAYDFLYPKSWLIGTMIAVPVPKPVRVAVARSHP